MENFQTIFAAYGADYDVTLRRFLGNESMYLRLLGLLPGDGNLEKLGAALDAGDLDRAFEAAHTLKGVAGNLGLAPFYEAVCAIVEPLRGREEGFDYRTSYGTILCEYERAIQFLADLRGVKQEP